MTPDTPNDDDSWTVVDAAFDRALDLEGDAREQYVASLEDGVRRALEPLLAEAGREDFLDRPDATLASLAQEEGLDQGIQVGPYRIESLVGEGGMGRVYRAHRADGAFDQTVAVKVVRQSLALAGSDVSARLRRERDLLAALDHPGIARLIDGGETPDGVPYLATEFVDGAPITDWADAHDLEVEDRVRLMIEVARAVDHAHRRFVVHRDIKPSNVMVTERDGAPRPVVLDFGIAKLLEDADDGTGAFPLTQTGMRLLTPAYAAPELFEPTSTVTTAADVYGLGALLYELLTGRRPHDDTPTEGAPTTEPTRPSTVVTKPIEDAPSFDTASRSRALRGDLDVICLSALHPDPARRYASAADLADDLERHLAGLPVEARPDSRAYVLGRFVRRNRSVVTAVSVAVLALVIGLVASLVSLSNEREALAEARASADLANEAAGLLGDLFRNASPESAGRGDVTIREALDRGLPRVATVEPASLRGYLYSVLGATYLDIGDFERSDSLLTVSADLLNGSDATPTVLAMNLRNQARSRTLRGDTQAALPLLLQADSLARLDTRVDSALVLDIANSLSWEYRNLQQVPEALEWAESAGELARTPSERAGALSSLSRAYFYDGRLDEAIEATGESIELYEESEGADGSSVGVMASQMAHNLMAAGRLNEAMPYARRAVRIARIVYDDDHVRRFESMGLLAQLLEIDGELREAEAYYDSTVTMGRDLPAARTATGMSMAASLAQTRVTLGDYAGAESAGIEALRIGETLPPEASRLDELFAMARLQTGTAMHQQGKRGARAMLDSAFASIERFPPQTKSAWMEDPGIQEADQLRRTLR